MNDEYGCLALIEELLAWAAARSCVLNYLQLGPLTGAPRPRPGSFTNFRQALFCCLYGHFENDQVPHFDPIRRTKPRYFVLLGGPVLISPYKIVPPQTFLVPRVHCGTIQPETCPVSICRQEAIQFQVYTAVSRRSCSHRRWAPLGANHSLALSRTLGVSLFA